MSSAYARRDLGLLFFLALIWGTAFAFIEIGLARFSPFLFAAFRFDIAGLLLLGATLVRRAGPLMPRGRRQWSTVVVAGILMAGAYHALLFWGQQFTTSGIAAIIVGLSPVLTIGFSAMFLRSDHIGWRGVLGVAVGFLGIVLLGTLKGGNLLDARGRGELAVVAAIASWALGSVLVKRSRHGMEVFAFSAWQALVGAVALHVSAWLIEGHGRAEWDLAGTFSLAYLAVVSSGLGFIIYFVLVERVGPLRVNVVSYIAPVVANVVGIAFLHERLEVRALVAFALIATSLSLVLAAKKGPRPVLLPSQPEDPGRVAP